MKFLLINHYALTPSVGRNMRTYSLAQELVDAGHEVSLIFGGNNPAIMPDRQLFSGVDKWREDGIEIIQLGIPQEYRGGLISRFFGWLFFAVKLFLVVLKERIRPHLILYSSLSLPAVVTSLLLSKILRCCHVFEIRDIYPLTPQLIMSLSRFHPVVLFLRCVELIGYYFSHAIITTMPGGGGWVRKSIPSLEVPVLWAPNGTDISAFDHQDDVDPGDGSVSVVYLGTLGVANKLDILIEAASLLEDYTKLRFRIYGAGGEEDKLKDMVTDMSLQNVTFCGSVRQDMVPKILATADILYHGSNAIDHLYEYGISPNKLAEYMASGRPIVNSYSGNYDPVREANCGLTSAAENPEELAANILTLYNDNEMRREMGEAAKLYAAEHLDYKEINRKVSGFLVDTITLRSSGGFRR